MHAALAEFDLAFHALSSYLELIQRSRSRAEKAGELAPHGDNDETAMTTLSEGVRFLCRYGALAEAEKAMSLGNILEEWLQQHQSEIDVEHTVDGDDQRLARPYQHKRIQYMSPLSPETVAVTFRAIGISQATWALWTPLTETRTDFQNQAVANLRKSVSGNPRLRDNIESNLALGLLLAEKRDLKGAINILRRVLDSNATHVPSDHYTTERKLMPVWHLLALLLSARQDFTTCSQVCEAAFKQFSSSSALFGRDRKPASTENSQHQHRSGGLVDQMGDEEKATILEIKMTQLALTEVLEDPETAVNSSHELLSLYVRLFDSIGLETQSRTQEDHLAPPKTSAGTIKSLRGSIFGRRKHIKSSYGSPVTGVLSPSSAHDATPQIQVTDEDIQARNSQDRQGFPLASRSPSKKLHKREGSLNRVLKRSSSRPGSSRQMDRPVTPTEAIRNGNLDGSPTSNRTATQKPTIPLSNEVGIAISPDIPTSNVSPTQGHDGAADARQPLPSITHNMPHTQVPAPAGKHDQPPQQDVRLPTVHPHTSATQPPARFPKAQAQKQALAMLIKIWLQIAALYRRALMFEDAAEACDEAVKQCERIEALVSSQESSAKAFSERGWGLGKSVDELWADIYAEKGCLLVAKDFPHEAVEYFERAISYAQDQPTATVGLSNILLDIYQQVIPSEAPDSSLMVDLTLNRKNITSETTTPSLPQIVGNSQNVQTSSSSTHHRTSSEQDRKSPEILNRLAARDRAYGLLSALTKKGTGWDNSEAWFALARAYELGGQIDKAKEVLWWCVELEDGRPIRHWSNVQGGGGYVL